MKILKFIALIFWIWLPIWARAQEPSHDRAATHGMVLFGSEKIYASHLPMFHSPHDYQIILELELTENTRKIYLENKKNSSETVYTLEPEKFVLPEMIKNPRPFKANIFRGHFERGGTQIIENELVTIKKVVYFRKFNPTEKSPENYQFLIFGNVNEQFAAHYISEKPDFDQIFTIRFTDKKLYKQLKKGSLLMNLDKQVNRQALEKGIFTTVDKKTSLDFYQLIYLEFDDLK
jgi:hypothetical protein